MFKYFEVHFFHEKETDYLCLRKLVENGWKTLQMGLFIFRNSTLLFTSLVLETPTYQGMEFPFLETWETYFHEVFTSVSTLHPKSFSVSVSGHPQTADANLIDCKKVNRIK